MEGPEGLADEGVAGVGAGGNGGEGEALIERGGEVFEGVDGEVDTAGGEGFFDFLDEDAFSIRARGDDEAGVLHAVAGGADDFDFDGVARGAENGGDVVGLPERELRAPGADADLSHGSDRIPWGTEEERMWAWWFVAGPMLMTAGFVGLVFWMRARRRARLRELAERLGMEYRGAGLPAGMDLTGTLFARVSSVWNVVEGRGKVAFDCTVGRGKTPWRMTVYGVKGRSSFGMKAGEWYLDSRARVWFARLDSVEEVERKLREMA